MPECMPANRLASDTSLDGRRPHMILQPLSGS
jgi:hypothetical protein